MKRFSVVLIPMLLLAQEPRAPKPHHATITWVQGTVQAGASCGVTSNKIYRGTKSGQEALLATTPSAVTTYTDSTVSAGATYFYQVTAVSCDGESPLSMEVSATIPHHP